MLDRSPYSTTSTSVQKQKGSSYQNYLWLGALLNGVIWGCIFLYLKQATPVYTSQVGVTVLGGDSKVDVSLPDGAKASASPTEGRAEPFKDPRNDYAYIATSSVVVDRAAQQLGMDADEFGEPEVTVDEETAILSFLINGETPLVAQRKSYALYAALDQHVQKLRESTLARREGETQFTLAGARQKVEKAQRALAKYQSVSAFGSDQQLEELSVNVEQLRRLRAENQAQANGLNGRLSNLESSTGAESQGAADRYKLEGDTVYQQLLSEYGRLKTELTQVAAQLSPQHPQIVDLQEQLSEASAALVNRGSSILGRQVRGSELVALSPLSNDPQATVVRGELFKESVVDRADRDKLIRQDQVLAKEITRMEARLNSLSQEKFKIDRLRRDLQVAETLLASRLAKLDLSQSDLYSIYPPIQLVTEPTLPEEDKPVSPSKQMAFLTGLAGSFVATLGLLLIWYEKRNPEPRLGLPEQELKHLHS